MLLLQMLLHVSFPRCTMGLSSSALRSNINNWQASILAIRHDHTFSSIFPREIAFMRHLYCGKESVASNA